MSTKRLIVSGLAAPLLALTLASPPALALPSGAQATQIAAAPQERAYQDSTVYRFGPDDALPAGLVTEQAAISNGQVMVDGRSISYTATTGHLTATDPQTQQPKATIFYVAYTAARQGGAERPVTFFYNGGPGSSSVWLHLGSYAPRRIVTGDPVADTSRPFPFVNNAQSLIDTTDMVFVDAVGTGLSEAIVPYANRSFWGVDADAAVFRDFIKRYLLVNHRSASPLYLFGESYGTPRTDVLANLLEMSGTRLSGIVLQSSILDYNSNPDMGSGSFAPYMPGYAAVGAYFKRVMPPPAQLEPFLNRMRSFASGHYGPAVRAFLGAHTPPAPDLLTQLYLNTGYPASAWQSHFNLDETTFRTGLIPGYVLGRYDARVIAANGSPMAADGDPSSTLITRPFTDRINDYLVHGLKYGTVTPYHVESDDAINDWVWAHDGLAMPDTLPDLAAAMYLNPALKVLSINGYHDLATPFFITEQDLGRLGTVSGLKIAHYPGGHMTYLYDPARPDMKRDLVEFYHRQP
ncbi:S10 family serine carboxypeptidase-like protein [Paludibacterium yongneupense]|uniref:S10 family serine carboxypeptidase-like protein n=1 Tax=Paludibacterium yongneupense TaxID=400061 RepID=UPI00040DD967|nr:peptidase S10 [Paludibacterium yongneupense]